MRKNLEAGSTWEISENANLTSLIISEGAVIAVPDGYKLTMTVNGGKKEIKAGKYSGKIALTVTKS